MRLLGMSVDAGRPTAWIVCMALLVVGAQGFRWLRPKLMQRWDAVTQAVRATEARGPLAPAATGASQ